MFWKANTAVNQFCHFSKKSVLQTTVTALRRSNRKSSRSTETFLREPRPGNCLISRAHFYIYEITNSGLLNPRCPYLEAVENRLLMQGFIFNDSCEGAPCRIVGRSFVMTCQRNQENFELELTFSPQQPDLLFVTP